MFCNVNWKCFIISQDNYTDKAFFHNMGKLVLGCPTGKKKGRGCFEDLRRFNIISVISRLGSWRYLISEIVAARSRFEIRTPCMLHKQRA